MSFINRQRLVDAWTIGRQNAKVELYLTLEELSSRAARKRLVDPSDIQTKIERRIIVGAVDGNLTIIRVKRVIEGAKKRRVEVDLVAEANRKAREKGIDPEAVLRRYLRRSVDFVAREVGRSPWNRNVHDVPDIPVEDERGPDANDEDLARIWDCLGHAKRNILHSIYIDGLTEKDTAKRYGLSRDQVARIKRRTMQELHEHLSVQGTI